MGELLHQGSSGCFCRIRAVTLHGEEFSLSFLHSDAARTHLGHLVLRDSDLAAIPCLLAEPLHVLCSISTDSDSEAAAVVELPLPDRAVAALPAPIKSTDPWQKRAVTACFLLSSPLSLTAPTGSEPPKISVDSRWYTVWQLAPNVGQ